MSTPTPDNLAPLIQDLQVQGRSLSLRFVCPRSGQAFPARHSLPASASNAVATRVQSTVSRTLMYSLRSALSSLVRSVFGHGIAGRVASDLAWSAMAEADRGRQQAARNLSASEQQQAILAAFEGVRSRFVWDGEARAWVSAEAARELMGAFQRQLAEAPIVHPYDRQVLSRMLVEIARADGRVSPEEASWLTDLLSADQGSLNDLAQRPPLTSAELRATSPGSIRVSLLAMAQAMALVDEQLDGKEQQALQRYASGLDLRPAEATAAATMARVWMMDQALERMATWGGHDPHARQQLYALAGRLGMNQQEAEEAEARFLRRSAR